MATYFPPANDRLLEIYAKPFAGRPNWLWTRSPRAKEDPANGPERFRSWRGSSTGRPAVARGQRQDIPIFRHHAEPRSLDGVDDRDEMLHVTRHDTVDRLDDRVVVILAPSIGGMWEDLLNDDDLGFVLGHHVLVQGLAREIVGEIPESPQILDGGRRTSPVDSKCRWAQYLDIHEQAFVKSLNSHQFRNSCSVHSPTPFLPPLDIEVRSKTGCLRVPNIHSALPSDTPQIIMRLGPIHYDGLPSPVQKPGSDSFPVSS